MSSLERPRSAYDRPPKNEKWGTVVETNLGLGKQKPTKSDVDAIVERLSCTDKARIPDVNRTGALEEIGIANSYAWKGY